MPAPDYQIDPPVTTTTPDSPTGTISVSSIPLFPRSDLIYTPETPVYLAFGVRVTYSRDHGLRYSPRAGEARDKLTALWRANSGLVLKTVVWLAQCFNDNPVVPHPMTGADNEVLLQDTVHFDVPQETADGQQTITFGGVYVYVLQKVPAFSDPLFVGRSPFNIRPARTFTMTEMSQSIIGPALNPAGFQGGAITF